MLIWWFVWLLSCALDCGLGLFTYIGLDGGFVCGFRVGCYSSWYLIKVGFWFSLLLFLDLLVLLMVDVCLFRLVGCGLNMVAALCSLICVVDNYWFDGLLNCGALVCVSFSWVCI